MTKKYALNSNEFNLGPKRDTIRFILNYSKALSVIDYKRMKFEILQN